MDELLRNIVDVWLRQIKAAEESKEEHFGATAKQVWRFLGASWRELYTQSTKDEDAWDDIRFAGAQEMYYKPRINLTGQYIATMGPYCLANVPNRMVTPRRPPIPGELLQLAQQAQKMAQEIELAGQLAPSINNVLASVAAAVPDQQRLRIEDEARAWLLQWWLNYLPGAYGLQREAEMAVIEALAKGRGVVWHELTDSPTGDIPGSFYDSVDNLFIDADAQQFRNAGFIVRKRRESVWTMAEKFDGTTPDMLRGAYRSHQAEAQDPEEVKDRDDGSTEAARRDVCDYYEIWSRAGLGQRFDAAGEKLKELRDALEGVGPYCYLAVMKGLHHPLNLPPHLLSVGVDAIEAAISWDFPTFENADNPWPCSVLDFLPDTESPWAISPLRAALPLQVFMDHLWAFLMCGTARRSKALVLVAKGLEESLREAIATGGDMQIVPVSQDSIKNLAEKLHYVDFGRLSEDLWKLAPLTQQVFEEMVGISSLLTHGGVGATQPRSATEMDLRDQRASSRPDDYADSVERWQSAIAAKEAEITRLQVSPLTVAPLFGERVPGEEEGFTPDDEENWIDQNLASLGPLTQLWALLVNTRSPEVACSEHEFLVEHGTGRRKNRQKVLQDIQTIGQTLLPTAVQLWSTTGDPTQINAFIEMTATALENDDILKMQLPDMPAGDQQQQAEGEEEGAPSETEEAA